MLFRMGEIGSLTFLIGICINHFPIAGTKIPMPVTYRRRALFSLKGFRGFSQWLVGSKAEMAWWEGLV